MVETVEGTDLLKLSSKKLEFMNIDPPLYRKQSACLCPYLCVALKPRSLSGWLKTMEIIRAPHN